MQTTLLPISICDKIDRRVRKFIWGSTGDSRKIHLVHWEGVCQTKKEGGLGFRKAHELNLAFLAKLVWLFTKKPDELWVQVLQSKYFKTVNGVLVAKSSARSSNLCRGMRRAWPVTKLGTLMRPKDGMSTSMWTDQWVETGVVLMDYLKEDSPPIDPCTPVTAFEDNGKWDLNNLSQFLPDELLLKIAGVQPPVEGAGEDVPTWGLEVNGQFSVRTAYSLATDCSDKDDAAKWKEIWKWRGPERVRHFLWLAMRERLLTNSERARRKLTTSTGCGACGCDEETVLHVLRDCDFARLTWMQLIPPSEHHRFFGANLQDWIERNLRSEHTGLDFGLTCWSLWKTRNDRVFAGKITTTATFLQRVQAWITALDKDRLIHMHNPPMRTEVDISWKPPPPEWMPFGIYSITRAELRGAVEGLQLAWDAGYRRVILELDSECACQLLRTSDLSEHHHVAILDRAQELLHRQWDVSVNHIYREGNKCADYLASQGHTVPLGFHMFPLADPMLCNLTMYDIQGLSESRVVLNER
ncbi:unnamed protein product [Linum tenue]|uniref:Uncharacterized protein n=1 Tax=Linum tenue TaxID=586396 RepID=A0AAV0Q7G5_9ROSI|nr:unnamed protein product [Linum tenue]